MFLYSFKNEIFSSSHTSSTHSLTYLVMRSMCDSNCKVGINAIKDQFYRNQIKSLFFSNEWNETMNKENEHFLRRTHNLSIC